MTTYRCTDGPSTRTIEYLVGDQYSGQESIRAASAEEAIDKYLDGGNWTPDEGGTVWYTITACDRDGERAERKVACFRG